MHSARRRAAKGSRRQLPFRALVLALALAGGGLVAELLLRATGREPWRFQVVDRREPLMGALDPVLGWRIRPGSYRYPAYADGLPEIEVTVLSDGSRRTGDGDPGGRPAVLVVGGSFSFGWAVSDRETFAWKLQEAFPEEAWINLAAPGYGTYQSLMTLERWFADSRPARRVIYGFIDHHEDRNVASHDWMRLVSLYPQRGQPAVPRVGLTADGTLVRHPLDRYRIWPLSHRSALIAALQDAFGGFSRRSRAHGKREVAQRLLEEMAALSRRHGSAFTVVVLNAGESARGEYQRFLADCGIESVDCHRDLAPELQVPGEGHPNDALHSLWAECVARALRGSNQRSAREDAGLPVCESWLRPARSSLLPLGEERGSAKPFRHGRRHALGARFVEVDVVVERREVLRQ